MKRFQTSLSLDEVAKIADGKLYPAFDTKISAATTLDEADNTSIAFYQDKKYLNELFASRAGAIIVPDTIDLDKLPLKNYILCKHPYLSFLSVITFLIEKEEEKMVGKKVHPRAVIAPDIALPDNIKIGSNAVIEANVSLGDKVCIEENTIIRHNSSIGSKSHIFSNVTIYPETVIGKNVRIHAGVVIGADGFGYLWDGKKHRKIPQLGKVIIEDEVEIGANTTIDRGTLGNTIIRKGTKIDNLVQIAHNVVVGPNAIICAQTGIAGSCEVGENSILAGQVGVADHVKIGKNVKVAAQSGVTNDVPDGKTIFGYPATDAQHQRRIVAAMRKLPEMRKNLYNIAKTIGMEMSKDNINTPDGEKDNEPK
jgi:UDP-3-O-[3-hydroxymyristoyl] glucosamine N-acyltransferase